MRKIQRQQVENFIKLLGQAHDEIKRVVAEGNVVAAQDLLSQCQQGAIELGNLIETIEGEAFATIPYLEDYCELIFQIYEEIGREQYDNVGRIHKALRKSLIKIENSVRNDIKIRKEAVFLPYKAAMWDSLESVYLAAVSDPNCDAYVIPIPYYDKNPDGSFKDYHYEGNRYPENVPLTWYEDYDFEQRRPDMIFIHNPYDDCNYVTSVHPFFYSNNLKQFTDCLVYIPYYATAGGMSEAQALCPAYLNADYIVIQSEKYRKYFDQAIPDQKFLPLGSPKFDSVIRKCQNPPEPPEEWKEKMKGRKVYFYNTSLNGMLENTDAFLKKMEYVFNTFEGRNDACLLWRPHPLLESTLDSMRSGYRPVYDALKKRFVENELGILDTTPDIEDTIALCDAYIGDAGTSVTSLFGVAGKPMFILNNNIHSLPEEDDWRGEIIKGLHIDGQDQWYVTQGNKLYYSEKNDFHYRYFCDLSEYAGGGYYQRAIEFEGKVYVCPMNAQDILIVSKDKQIKKIELQRLIEQRGAFADSLQVGEYLFLLPNKYPTCIRFHMRTQEIQYITGIHDIFVVNIDGERRAGRACVWNGALLIGSPDGSKLVKLEADSLKTELFDTAIKGGIAGMRCDKDDVWTVPYEGTIVTCRNLKTGETAEYDAGIRGFQCIQRPLGYVCTERPFYPPIRYEEKVIFPPNWGNQFICIDGKTGSIREWESPVSVKMTSKNGYMSSWGSGYFAYQTQEEVFRYFDIYERRIYDINVITKECREIEVSFDRKELESHTSGFSEESQWMQYCCNESAFNSLKDFVDGNITGNPFNRAQQTEAFSRINASVDGDCGEKIYRFASDKLM